MDWYLYPAVVGAGLLCGFINTLAGGGSLITLPLLIFLGLPANVANGTNRVAILLQNIAAVNRFHRKSVLDWRRGLLLAIPATIGAIVGARIAVDLEEGVLRQVIGILMVLMLVLILVKPQRWLKGKPELAVRRPGWLQILVFFLVGAYGGFIQAGVGFFLLSALVMGSGYNLDRANAVKVLIILCFTVFALTVFVWKGQVRWGPGLLLALGNMAGAYVAVEIKQKYRLKFAYWLLVAMVVVSATVLLGITDRLGEIF